MSKTTIAILGIGNMGGSLLNGLITRGFSPEHLSVYDPSDNIIKNIQHRASLHIGKNNEEAVHSADVIILAVKPQMISSVAKEIAPFIQQRKPLVISVAAGILEASLASSLGKDIPIVRCMPNTPALIGCGASALYANVHVSAEQKNTAEFILSAVGIVVWLEDERLMNVATALSGSGPAYFFLLIEALQHAATQLGLPAETARLLTLQTAYGATRMALESNESVIELRKRVTSPGGTTEKAIDVLQKAHFQNLLLDTLQAATTRAEELAHLFGK
jgi:pyrroline-5-carboxylate reductase